MGLDLLERSRMPRSTGSLRQDLIKRGRGGEATFGIQFGFSKRPPDARSAPFWVDLKLATDQGWFVLFENAAVQFGPRPSGRP